MKIKYLLFIKIILICFISSSFVHAEIKNKLIKKIQDTQTLVFEFKVDVPGTYALVDHSIYRVAKGAIGHLVVEGDSNPKVIRQGK